MSVGLRRRIRGTTGAAGMMKIIYGVTPKVGEFSLIGRNRIERGAPLQLMYAILTHVLLDSLGSPRFVK